MKRQIKQILSKPYARILIPDDDGTYTAEILEFPGCYGEGETAADAIDDLEQAAASWIEGAIKQGQEIPAPLDSCEYSGKINLRLPKSIHKHAARFAKRDDISLNQFFLAAISARPIGRMEESAFTFSLRTASALKDEGGSMLTSASSCIRWF